MSRLDEDRQFWRVAGTFPADKCAVYPEHASVQEFARSADMDVLEYGCGGGSDGISYLQAGARSVVFADIVEENLRVARARVRERGLEGRARFWHLRHSDELPPDLTFDVINAHGVLHHLPARDMMATLCSMRAALRDSGRLYAMLYSEHLRERCEPIVAGLISSGLDEEAAFGSATDGDGCIARWYTEPAGWAAIAAAGLGRLGDARLYSARDFRTFVAAPARADGRFVVIVPTYNRVQTMPRALDSLLAQTDHDWICYVLDDGSTDGTAEVVAAYTRRDPRFFYARYPTNRGGVAMNEIGMDLAVSAGTLWSRLGSDDWFLPHKLERDRVALAQVGVCFGPYVDDAGGGINGPQDARATLRANPFSASWANIAARTEVLEAVRRRYGTFCDPRLRNMEDWLWNTRAARVATWAWRAGDVAGRVIVGPTRPDELPFEVEPDAHYTIAAQSATYGTGSAISARDMALTEQIIGEDRARDAAAGLD